jgi:hypothetical protein
MGYLLALIKALLGNPPGKAGWEGGDVQLHVEDSQVINQPVQNVSPLSMREVARISSDVLVHEIRERTVPWWLLNLVLGAVGRFSRQAADIREMVSRFQSGRYVADLARQREAFGPVPTAEEGVARRLREAGLAPVAGSVAASAGARPRLVEG